MTAQEAADIRARLAMSDQATQHLRSKSGWLALTPEQQAAYPRPSNEECSALEVYEFNRDKPARYFAYVKLDRESLPKAVQSCTITTWTGDVLGRGSVGPRTYDNFGGYRRHLSFYGTNGVYYHGWHYESSGDYCRFRAHKYQEAAA